MSEVPIRVRLALASSLGLHAALLALWMIQAPPHPRRASTLSEPLQVTLTNTHVRAEPARIEHFARPRAEPATPTPPGAEDEEHLAVTASIPPSPTPEKQLASMPAPPPPTAEDWALASTYTLKNSKRYRYSWGQQVRSMMGTAVEGERQGLVRFHIEIAPDGTLARVEVLWSTSEIAEKLAVQAIRAMPPLPPTPTGKPLVFEKTIAFLPFETGWPPIYKNDCLPDPPSFSNRFAWNGASRQPTSQAPPENVSRSDSAARETECPGAGPDSIEAEEKDMERQFKEWRAARLNGAD